MLKLFKKKQTAPKLAFNLLLDKRFLWEKEIQEILSIPDILLSYDGKRAKISSLCDNSLGYQNLPILFPNRVPDINKKNQNFTYIDQENKKLTVSAIINDVKKDNVFLALTIVYQENDNKVVIQSSSHEYGNKLLKKTEEKNRNNKLYQELKLNLSILSFKSNGQSFIPTEPNFPWDAVQKIIDDINTIQEMKNSLFLSQIESKLKHVPEEAKWLPGSMTKAQFQNVLSEELAVYKDNLVKFQQSESDQVAEKIAIQACKRIRMEMSKEIEAHNMKIKDLNKYVKALQSSLDADDMDFGPN